MYINGSKYACSSCIKGHRSSQCNHADRPLIEIRKKGRPITQCSFCRDLRKKHQVHIKCVCNGHDKRENNSLRHPHQITSPLHSQTQTQTQQVQTPTEHSGNCTASTDEIVITTNGQCACLSKLLSTTTKQIIPFISVPSSVVSNDRLTPSEQTYSQKLKVTQDALTATSLSSAPLCPTATTTSTTTAEPTTTTTTTTTTITTTTTTRTSAASCNSNCASEGNISEELLPSSSSSITSDYTCLLDSLPSAVNDINLASSGGNSLSNHKKVDKHDPHSASIKPFQHYHTLQPHPHFHKPLSGSNTSQRFLDGQPRIRTSNGGCNSIHRKKSATKRGCSSSINISNSSPGSNNNTNNPQAIPTSKQQPQSTTTITTTATTATDAVDYNHSASAAVIVPNVNSSRNGLSMDTFYSSTIRTVSDDNSLSTPPPSIASPLPSTSLTATNTANSNYVFRDTLSSSVNLVDMQFDYLTEQLEILSNNNYNNNCCNNSFPASSSSAVVTDIFNTGLQDELLNSMLCTTTSTTTTTTAAAAGAPMSTATDTALDEDTTMDDLDLNSVKVNNAMFLDTSPAATMTATTSTTNPSATTSTIIQPSPCGSFIPHSSCTLQALSNNAVLATSAHPGESVVITITPLSDHPSQSTTTTRIVTCYCGSQCMCPGCLVHPHQQFIYNNCSSTTTTDSSCCSEEDKKLDKN